MKVTEANPLVRHFILHLVLHEPAGRLSSRKPRTRFSCEQLAILEKNYQEDRGMRSSREARGELASTCQQFTICCSLATRPGLQEDTGRLKNRRAKDRRDPMGCRSLQTWPWRRWCRRLVQEI